jgi:LPS sulfotransferase NodH
MLAAALGVSGTGTDADGSIVANQSLLDADDDTVEELTVEEANDLDMDEIIEEAEEEAEEELALEKKQQEDNGNNLPQQDYQRFLIFAEQRSGSRFLTDLLDDHDQIICGNEELNHKDTSMNLKHVTIEEYMTLLDETYDDVFHSKTSLSSANTIGGNLVVGYKVMYNQGVTHFGKDLMARLDKAGIKVIHLIRRNKLLQYISFASNEKDKHLMADKKKAAELAAAAAAAAAAEGGGVPLKHQAHPKTKEDAQRIRDELTISGKHPDKILSFMEAREADDRTVSSLVSTYLDTANYAFVDYEDLSRETEVQMERLFDLLGVEQRKVQSQMEKIHEGKLTRDYFKKGQQDAVKEALEKSEFRWMLDGW